MNIENRLSRLEQAARPETMIEFWQTDPETGTVKNLRTGAEMAGADFARLHPNAETAFRIIPSREYDAL